ncbi:MAG: dihydrolipoyl dehydrogenase, partial [Simkaniaceae bacterium]|nr:dihydrolipoyl dehydrogenase [Simkaniaceae bacterium]
MYDLIVIGSGPGGYVSAIHAAKRGLKVACVEKGPLGGTCLNVGCIPSKTLLHSSEFYEKVEKESLAYGLGDLKPMLDFDKMMARKCEVITGFNQGIAALFKGAKVDSIQGHAKFVDAKTIEVEGKTYTAKNFILATGSEPTPLPFLPIDEETILSSTGALALKNVPKSLLVVGAGIIGVELGSVYARLGCEVTFVEFMDRICPTLDVGISKAFQKILEKQGLKFHLSHKVVSAEGTTLKIEGPEGEKELTGEKILVAIGRRPFTEGLDLEKAGITKTERGFVTVDTRFRTSASHIYAIGDLIDGPMLAHKASEEGIAVAEMLAGENPTLDYMAVPSVVYTSPEIGSVGFTEEELKERKIAYKASKMPFKSNSRAVCVGEVDGLIKVLSDKESGLLLGVHILGPNASELIAGAVIAITNRLTAY